MVVKKRLAVVAALVGGLALLAVVYLSRSPTITTTTSPEGYSLTSVADTVALKEIGVTARGIGVGVGASMTLEVADGGEVCFPARDMLGLTESLFVVLYGSSYELVDSSGSVGLLTAAGVLSEGEFIDLDDAGGRIPAVIPDSGAQDAVDSVRQSCNFGSDASYILIYLPVPETSLEN